MWYSGAYTLQLNLKPAGLNGLPDARIYDGAKRDRSIWTCDMLIQAPTAISTLGNVGAEFVKSSLNVLLATQRADGALPGSPDFRKGTNPAGSPLFYSNNYSGCGVRGVIAYYRYTGDSAYLTSVLPALRNELAYNDTFLDANNLVVSNDRDFWQATQTGEVTEPFGNGMETAGRFAAGDSAGAFDLMRRTWGPMVDKENPLYTGGLWEFKNSTGGVNRTTASLAHGWAASPTVQLTEQVLGITPVDPGYATWSIKPHPGNLTSAEGAVPTRFGDLAARWSSAGPVFTLHAETPAGTTGTIAVPATGNALVLVDGRIACGRGTCTPDNGYLQFTVSGG